LQSWQIKRFFWVKSFFRPDLGTREIVKLLHDGQQRMSAAALFVIFGFKMFFFRIIHWNTNSPASHTNELLNVTVTTT